MSESHIKLQETIRPITTKIMNAFADVDLSYSHQMVILMNTMINCALREGLTKKQLIKDFTETVNIVPGDDWADWIAKFEEESSEKAK